MQTRPCGLSVSLDLSIQQGDWDSLCGLGFPLAKCFQDPLRERMDSVGQERFLQFPYQVCRFSADKLYHLALRRHCLCERNGNEWFLERMQLNFGPTFVWSNTGNLLRRWHCWTTLVAFNMPWSGILEVAEPFGCEQPTAYPKESLQKNLALQTCRATSSILVVHEACAGPKFVSLKVSFDKYFESKGVYSWQHGSWQEHWRHNATTHPPPGSHLPRWSYRISAKKKWRLCCMLMKFCSAGGVRRVWGKKKSKKHLDWLFRW